MNETTETTGILAADAVAQDSATAWLPEDLRVPIAALLMVALVGYFIARIGMLPMLHALTKRSKIWWDDVLADARVLSRLSWLVPLVIIHQGIRFIPGLGDSLDAGIQRLLAATMVVVCVAVISALCQAANEAYAKTEASRERPIKGYVQVLRLAALLVGSIVFIATLLDRSPWYLLSGLGAMTAVLMLVFRDTILGFVAGVQITANKLLHVGDWIEMPQFNADGDVIDISLNVVQIQNWDKTISVIPAHKFLEHSFKNWRGMQQAGGRRIARAIDLDLSSIRFVDGELLESLSQLQLLKPFVVERMAEIETWNAERAIDTSIPGNGRRMTNIGCFRAYVIAWLKNHPKIRQDMTFLVRQLAPGPTGLPIQIYVFTATTEWGEYEAIQADIFDHLYATLPHFALRAFQHPTGADMREMVSHAAG